MFFSLTGEWRAQIDDGNEYLMILPGTLDQNRIGYEDKAAASWHPDITLGNAAGSDFEMGPIATRFTRKNIYEGTAFFSKRVAYLPPAGKRIFLEVERARCLKLLIDQKEVDHYAKPSLSTPHIFEVTGLLNGDNQITLVSDNSYPGLPHDAIVFSSAATDETQTNWNGILGYIRLRIEEPFFLSAVRVYPQEGELKVQVELDADRPYDGKLELQSKALTAAVSQNISVRAGAQRISFNNLPLQKDLRYWDEYEGNRYQLTASLTDAAAKTVSFGIRRFGDNGKGRLALNGRTLFIRSETNCAVFPEIGHPPMEKPDWIDILEQFKAYGVNCMRFHSYCPPEAAFEAADQIGMLMQPELSHWNPKDALDAEESYAYYQTELEQIILTLANHPSFVMLTLGNELQPTAIGQRRMDTMLKMARWLDDTRLYANGANVFYAEKGCDPESDFYTSQGFYQEALRGSFSGIDGFINNQYPNAMTNYDETMKALRKTYQKPVFSFEAGQYEVLPDFDELAEFRGITEPANLRLIQKRAEEKGLTAVWKQYVEATGVLSRIAYREEIEAAMRTEELSGISLLGLQDFPGQGTALVGMLNSHLQPKPYRFAEPAGFHRFFRAQLPLVYLPRYTYENSDILIAEIRIANYGRNDIKDCLSYELKGNGIALTGSLSQVSAPAGTLAKAGILKLPLDAIRQPSRLDLTVSINSLTNTYPVWVYPPVQPSCPESVYETRQFDQSAAGILAAGGTVYLTPASTKEALPNSIQAQFTTDFWSVGTFPMQEGGMGQFIDAGHPLFADFPTETHTNWQWWPMATQRAVILPEPIKAIVTEMDSYAYMRPMAQIFECRCGNGKLLFSSLDLKSLQHFPEARALLNSIYRYLDSERCNPEQIIEPEVIQSLVERGNNDGSS